MTHLQEKNESVSLDNVFVCRIHFIIIYYNFKYLSHILRSLKYEYIY